MNVHDVAAYILTKYGRMSAMKLQKLVYYCQAWSLVWDDRRLFPESIETWANGPIVPALYEQQHGQFDFDIWPCGDANNLDAEARETVDAVMDYYGKHNAQWLSDLTHLERPWRESRAGLQEGERGGREITPASLSEFYSSLDVNGKEAA